jgi:hypothetical protein
MQTFVPLTSGFEETAKVLDNKRLNKQALEGWQILMTLFELNPQGEHRIPKGWVNHPAVKMWRGHEVTLYLYIQEMVEEWKRRGFNSTIGEKAHATMKAALALGKLGDTPSMLPHWMSNPELFKQITSSHRQALLVKDYAWYHQFNWPEDTGVAPTEYNYIWPV